MFILQQNWLPVFLIFVLLLFGSAKAEVVKSPSDHRDYVARELTNGLKVLLISDPNTDKSAAALDIKVGSGDDPQNRQGLAHLLEHMLFLGTERYPEPGEYQAFITKHGGSNNAYTLPNHTNYYFDIEAEFLQEALLRFSDFFVSPMFNPVFVKRERTIVAAEFSSKLQSDGRRFIAARRQAFNPLHHEFGFAVGDEKTLADREGELVRDDLIEFFNHHYKANRMTLVVLGQESTKVLGDWVEKFFGDIPSQMETSQNNEVSIYSESTLPLIQKIKPIKEIRQAVFSFSIPSVTTRYPEKPLSYIANLLGHEGEGSLLAALKKRGWAEALSAGGGLSYEKYGTFEVNISLTKTGLQNYENIGDLLFRAIREIENNGVKSWIFDEQKQLAEMNFRFREDVEAYTLVRAFASRMHRFPIKDLYYAPYRYDSFNRDLILYYLAYLQPRNLHLLLLGPELETDQIEKYYGVEYSLEAAPSTLINGWNTPLFYKDLYLPPRNPFIPTDLVIRQGDKQTQKPQSHQVADGFTLWFHNDSSYDAPRGNFFISVRSPMSRLTAEEAILTELYTEIVIDQLSEFSYPAQLAGLNYELYDHRRGFSFKISGYTDKQDALLKKIVQALNSPEVSPERFDRLRTDLIRRLRNFSREPPYAQGLSDLRRLLLENAWWPEQQISIAQNLTHTQLINHIPNLLAKLEVVGLAHGSYSKEEALVLAEIVNHELIHGRDIVSVPHADAVRIKNGETYYRTLNIDHPDFLTILYAQAKTMSIDERARFYLAGQLFNAPFYQRLRTEQQMGYFVFCGAIDIMEVPGFVLVVQSPDKHPNEIEAAIFQFLEDFEKSMENMEELEFIEHRTSLVKDIMKVEEKLRDRSGRYWTEIDREHYTFESRENLTEAVTNISFADFQDFFLNSIIHPNVSRIVIRSYGKSGDKKMRRSDKEIVDPMVFRSQMTRFVN
ncbi:MAG: hypothetical protein CL402_04670 [Acidiferrobacteraceae bacterium]|nr:hypothetical protein [Acidiferrobacteraceae bacterium]